MVKRETVDLRGYPDLVVIYLGMKALSLKGLFSLFKIGPQLGKIPEEKPDGLLLHESLIYGLFPLHVGMRQYWRDLESLEKWTRTMPHMGWWKAFLKDSGGTSFWHETYFLNGGMEAVYLDIDKAVGFAQFAPRVAAKGAMFSARRRAGIAGEGPEAPVKEEELR